MGYNEEIFILVGEGPDERVTSCEFFNHRKGEIRKKYTVAWLLSGFVSIRENIQRRYFQSLVRVNSVLCVYMCVFVELHVVNVSNQNLVIVITGFVQNYHLLIPIFFEPNYRDLVLILS